MYRTRQEEGFGTSGFWFTEQRTSFGLERVGKLYATEEEATLAYENEIAGKVTQEEVAFVLEEAKKLSTGWDGTERRAAYKAFRMEDCDGQ